VQETKIAKKAEHRAKWLGFCRRTLAVSMSKGDNPISLNLKQHRRSWRRRRLQLLLELAEVYENSTHTTRRFTLRRWSLQRLSPRMSRVVQVAVLRNLIPATRPHFKFLIIVSVFIHSLLIMLQFSSVI
jgi:hypothetical protein